MSQLDVDQLLSSLREHGTIDSRGEFTISLAEARRKLTQFGSSTRRRYLLLLVSSGIGAGASAVTITSEPQRYRLRMPGAYLPESQLLGSFARSLSDSDSATDMVLGLQAVFAEGAESVEVRLTHPEKASFRWTLSAEAESSKPGSAAEPAMEVEIAFPRNLRQRLQGLFGLRGYAGQPEELRLLEQMCDHSQAPIVVNGESLNRPFFFTPESLVARVGECATSMTGGSTVWHLPAPGCPDASFAKNRDTTALGPADNLMAGGATSPGSVVGLLALGEGSVLLVVRGVTLAKISDVGMNGILYHDALTLDLTREQVVEDHRYETMMADLESLRLDMLERALREIATLDRPSVRSFFVQAVAAVLREQVSFEAGEALLAWISPRDSDLAPPAPLRERLVAALQQIRVRHGFADLAQVEGILLEQCAAALSKRAEDVPEIFALTLRELQRWQPEETLMPGYLLLGLGAYFSARGEESVAQSHWMRALDVVRAGRDSNAENLIHAHMDFPVAHIMEQTSNAISIFLRTV